METLGENTNTISVSPGKLSFTDNKGNSETAAYIKSWMDIMKRDNGLYSSASVGNNENELSFEIVSARTVENLNDKKYVAYTMLIRKPFGTEDPYPCIIERRYTDFLALFMCLRQSFPAAFASFNFPKKLLIGNFSAESIVARSFGFESLFALIAENARMRESIYVTKFLQDKEIREANSLIIEKKYDQAITIIENCFRLLNKFHTDRNPSVLRSLCLLLACCEASNNKTAVSFADLALHRYEAVSDTDLLRYYVPLLKLCSKIYSETDGGNEKMVLLEDRLRNLKRQGIKVDGLPTLLDIVLQDVFPS